MLNRRKFVSVSAAGVATLAWGCSPQIDGPFIRIHHLPTRFPRRANDLTANVCGELAEGVTGYYRLNGGDWRKIMQKRPRVPPPRFTIELEGPLLIPGENVLELKTEPGSKEKKIVKLDFVYDPSPITLPLTVDWSSADLDVGDGEWETAQVDGRWIVRPVPGTEEYDRTLVVTGSFPAKRRIRTDFIFRGAPLPPIHRFGFGVLALWGGRPDSDMSILRRGWSFGLAWYYSHYGGFGAEFSYKKGSDEPRWVSTYRNFELVENQRTFVDIEIWPELNSEGKHCCYHQRFRWRVAEDKPWGEWLILSDIEGASIPEGEYAIAFIAHRAQVEYGPVTISEL